MERKFTDQELVRRKKLEKLIELGLDPYLNEKFDCNHSCLSFKSKYEKYSSEQLHESHDVVKIAGRVIAIRQTFGLILDFSGKLQFYLNKKKIDPKIFTLFKNFLDIGDIVGITGKPMKTNTGQITINVDDFVILAKSLIPLPEKFHGLNDQEIRARKRYLDLIVNQESMNTFVLRSKIIKYIREYMNNNDFFEVETPILERVFGGATAKPFITHYNSLNTNYYLRIATELSLKKLIVGGFEKVYEIGRIFRNEGMDTTHNPEFTSIEAYQAYGNLDDMMTLCENLIKYIATKINKTKIKFKNIEIDLTQPYKKINMVDFIKEVVNIDFNLIKTDQEAIDLANKYGINPLPHENTKGHIINLFFEKYCESKCVQPTFVTGHPLSISPLAKKDPKNNEYTRRFELYICGVEYANAFSELNDPIDQLQRFQNQCKEKNLSNDEVCGINWEFIDALEYGMPPTGGIGIGIDRLVMLLTQKESIHDVLLFPHMKNKK